MSAKTMEIATYHYLPANTIAVGAAIGSMLVISALHFAKPELNPRWHLLSEYALGRFGWMMSLAFILMGVSYLATAIGIFSSSSSVIAKVGVAILVAAGLAATAAAFLPMDPPALAPQMMTVTGRLHSIMGMIAIPGFPVAAILLTLAITRIFPAGQYNTLLWLAAHATWISFIAMVGYLAIVMPRAGGFGPGVSVGVFNRIAVVADFVWIITLPWVLRHSAVGN